MNELYINVDGMVAIYDKNLNLRKVRKYSDNINDVLATENKIEVIKKRIRKYKERLRRFSFKEIKKNFELRKYANLFLYSISVLLISIMLMLNAPALLSIISGILVTSLYVTAEIFNHKMYKEDIKTKNDLINSCKFLQNELKNENEEISMKDNQTTDLLKDNLKPKKVNYKYDVIDLNNRQREYVDSKIKVKEKTYSNLMLRRDK